MKLAPFLLALAVASCQMPLRNADAQIQPGPNLSPQGFPFLFAPRFRYLGPPVPVTQYGPVLPPPLAYAPPPPTAGTIVPPPPPPPLGWVFTRYTVCPEPRVCPVVFVSVGADGLNVRTVPDGPPIMALVNGTPLVVLTRAGRWTLVAPACELVPTGLWSWTAGVSLGACL